MNSICKFEIIFIHRIRFKQYCWMWHKQFYLLLKKIIHARGITCLDSRCTPSCYLINYEIKPEEATQRQMFASDIKTVQDLESYVEENDGSSNATYVEDNSVTNAVPQHGENPSRRFIFHSGHGKSITFC